MRIRNLARPWLLLGAALLVGVLLAGVAMAQTSKPAAKPALNKFKMVRSQSAAAVKGNKCLNVTLNKAAKNTDFTVFLLQQPNSPFGVSWYQGDISTDKKGHGTGHFVGIFNDEVFAISPGAVKPPKVDNQDAKKGVEFAPIHTFHLGVWFADPKEGKAAGCSPKGLTVTPFDGDHEAGIQALSTRNFPAQKGPLGQ
jgi:hypothetical protein